MIACGFEDVREHKPAVSGKNPVHPVHRCESKIYPCLTMNRFPATRRRRLFQTSGAPALPGRSYEGETGVFRNDVNDSPTPFSSILETILRHAGQDLFQRLSGAPALPGRSSFLVASWITLFFCLLFQTSGAPCPAEWADHSRVKQGRFRQSIIPAQTSCFRQVPALARIILNRGDWPFVNSFVTPVVSIF